jgi:hypothetical protein
MNVFDTPANRQTAYTAPQRYELISQAEAVESLICLPTAADMAGMDWSQLPEIAMVNLVRAAGQSGRHGRHILTLVCSSWAEAVAAANALVDELDVDRCVMLKRCLARVANRQQLLSYL